MAFLCSSPQIGTMQSPSSCTGIPPAPVVSGPIWMGPGSGATAHTSASRAGRALEGCLRHLLHRAVAPSASTTYRAGIRKYCAFCHKFNLTTLSRNQALHQPFLSQTGSEEGSSMGEGSLSKWACLPLLTSCLEE